MTIGSKPRLLLTCQAERLLRVQTLAAEATYGPGSAPRKPLHWYIMTSPFTHDETLAHFKQHAFFGLKEEQVQWGASFFRVSSVSILFVCLIVSGGWAEG